MPTKDLIQRSDNTKIDIGTAELPKWKAPFVPDYFRGQQEYNKGNYTDPHAKAYAEKTSGKIESVSPEFELLTALGLKGAKWLFSKSKNVISHSDNLVPNYSKKYNYEVYVDKPEKDLIIPDGITPNSPLAEATNYHRGRLFSGAWERTTNTSLNSKNFDFINHLFKPINYKDTKAMQDMANKFNVKFSGRRPRGNLSNRPFQSVTPGVPENRSFTVIDPEKAYTTYTPTQIRTIISHEVNHGVNRYGWYNLPEIEGFDFSNLPKGLRDYFTEKKGSELASRGTQIKNYFGIKDDKIPITGDMLRYAAYNMIRDTKIDNDLTPFFSSIIDFDKAAKYLTKAATVYGGATMLNNKVNKQNNVK